MQAPKKTVPARDALRAKAKLAVEQVAVPKPDRDAIVEGRKPLPARAKGAAALMPLPPIDKDFKFVAAETDAELHYLQADLLLEQAAGLLER